MAEGDPNAAVAQEPAASADPVELFIAAGRAKLEAALAPLDRLAEVPTAEAAGRTIKAAFAAAMHAVLSHIAGGLHPGHVAAAAADGGGSEA